MMCKVCVWYGPYSFWPAQHDSNVRPTPLEEFVAAGMCIYINGLQRKNGTV
jgi:hypothetical protein